MPLADKIAAANAKAAGASTVAPKAGYVFTPTLDVYVTPAINAKTGKANATAGQCKMTLGDYRNSVSTVLCTGRDPSAEEIAMGGDALLAMLESMQVVLVEEFAEAPAVTVAPATIVITPRPAVPAPATGAASRLAQSIVGAK